MANISGIQISSGFVKNSTGPLDKKRRLTTSERLSLSFVQRSKGMDVYDTDLDVWMILKNDIPGDITVEDDWELSGRYNGKIINTISFNEFIISMFFDELNTGEIYQFTHDLTGNGERLYTFFSTSENSTGGSQGINIHATIDGRILMEYYDENNDIKIEEIAVVFETGQNPINPLVFEQGMNTDNLILN